MAEPTRELLELHQTSAFVELYVLDCTAIGGSVYRFTPNVRANHAAITFGGLTYTAIPIITDGWDFSATGAPPKPRLSISNVSKVLLGAVISLGDLVGSTLTRVRTFEKFLDGGSNPDPNRYLGPDVYVVEQKLSHDNEVITWQLTSIIDRMGMYLPRRQVLKDKGFPGVARTRIR